MTTSICSGVLEIAFVGIQSMGTVAFTLEAFWRIKAPEFELICLRATGEKEIQHSHFKAEWSPGIFAALLRIS